jgi:hypothetical protein
LLPSRLVSVLAVFSIDSCTHFCPNKRRPRCTVPFLAVPLPAGVCLYAFDAQLEGLNERTDGPRVIYDTPCPTDFHLCLPSRYTHSLGDTLVFVVAAPGGQQHNKHTDRLTALDNERVHRLNTLRLLQASVQLRQALPHSCIRNCTPPVWSAAVQQQTAAAVLLQQRIRYVSSASSLFSHTHRPPAATALLRNLPPASNAARKLGWLAAAATSGDHHGGRDSTRTHTHTHTHTHPLFLPLPSAKQDCTASC